MPEPSTEEIDSFIKRWENSGGHERGAGHQFLLEFCELLDLGKPDPPVADNAINSYTFERRVERKKANGNAVPNWIDLYKSGHFVMETKQGVNRLRDKSDPDQPLLPKLDNNELLSGGHGKRGSSAFDKALERAHAQGERYIHALPAEEGRPPFLIVCDVGHSFDLYAEFSGTGGQYERFPDPRSHRIHLKDFHKQETRDLFRKIWIEPRSLDPSKYAAEVTREVAKALAELAKSLEKDGHDPQVTAGFLQRCLFTMFAEDVGLLPSQSFLKLLHIAKESPAGFPVLLNGLWKDMDKGAAFSAAIHATVIQFNGGLFKDCSVLPLRPDQIIYLIHSAKQDWSHVEPAIFGTLLERALDPRERHKLGAHYTPRSYVERLVRPTLIDPLREKWEAVRAAAAQLDEKGKIKEARATVGTFHKELASIRVLDPACGSGNFLYVALELIKRLEAEVLDLFEKLGGDRALEMNSVIVRPDNFLGIELNARAAAIAQIVLWIGYFQFHRRATGKADTNDRPLLPKHNTIECRDAVLAYDEKIPRRDPDTGEYVTIWDGRTTKPHPVTGKEVPDESARTNLFDYTNPKRAEWPQADYIVGNPPFLGNKRMRDELGDGYVDALRSAWKSNKPDSWDFVMFWWFRAAEAVRDGRAKCFGLITTNSIHQTFNRRCVEPFILNDKKPISIIFAIPDHPWVDSVDGAAVRIAMTAGSLGNLEGSLVEVEENGRLLDGEITVSMSISRGKILPQIRIGADVHSALDLLSNGGLAWQGPIPVGEGFRVERHELKKFVDAEGNLESIVKPYRIGRDIVQREEERWIIDTYGLSCKEIEILYPNSYCKLLVDVKPHRESNKDKKFREKWWEWGRPRPGMRESFSQLGSIIGTCRTAKHRLFVSLCNSIVPDAKIIAIGLDRPELLGVLSSFIHSLWAEHIGVRMGMGNDLNYNHADCFNKFPFPALDEDELKTRIRELGEKLDVHRKGRQAAHPDLTLTGMYNVLDKLRAEEPLNDKEKKIHDEGLVTFLKQIHDDLDAAVFESYGWKSLGYAMKELENGRIIDPTTGGNLQIEMPDGVDRIALLREHKELLEQDLLTRLVALNHERAAEEKRGLVRWLRPEYQAPEASKAKDIDLPLEVETSDEAEPVIAVKLKWPSSLDAQFAEIRKLLPTTGPNASTIAAFFGNKTKARIGQIEDILKTLKSLGKLE